MQAIIPAAGLGTRMSSVTNGRAKELLPLAGRPVLEWIIEEAVRAEVDGVIVVSSPVKPEIDEAVAHLAAGRFRDAGLRVVHQQEPLGLANAVLSAEVFAEDVLILLGDTVYRGDSPMARMANLLARGIDGAIAVEEVSDAEVEQYGICEVNALGSIRSIVEKPRATDTCSRWAVAGRYALNARAFSHLADLYHAGESGFTALLSALIAQDDELKAVALQPGQERIDCGSPTEYSVAELRSARS